MNNQNRQCSFLLKVHFGKRPRPLGLLMAYKKRYRGSFSLQHLSLHLFVIRIENA